MPSYYTFAIISTGLTQIRWNDIGTGALYFVFSVIIIYAALLLATSFLRFQNIISSDLQKEDVDPHDAFMIKVAGRISMLRSRPPPFWLLLIAPHTANEADSMTDIDLESLLETVRPLFRFTDDMTITSTGELLVFLDSGKDQMPMVHDRIAPQLSKVEVMDQAGSVVCRDLRVGCALFPESAERAGDLIKAAGEALRNARCGEEAGKWVFGSDPTPEQPENEEEKSSPPAYIDPVTGLLKETRSRSTAQKFISQFRREGDEASIMMLRADGLDRHVENFGEDIVAAIQKDLSNVLQSNLRGDDLIACWEDRSFIIGIEGGSECAFDVAKRLISQFKGRKVEHESYVVRYTVSIGIATYPQNGRLPREILHASSLALSDAARKGRNVFAAFEPKMLKIDHERSSRGVF